MNAPRESTRSGEQETYSRRRLLVVGLSLLGLGTLTAVGCASMGQQEPQQAQTVPDWLRQPRPGKGIIGP